MKRIAIILMILILGGHVYAQHQAGDMLLGLEAGIGTNFGGNLDDVSSYPYPFFDFTMLPLKPMIKSVSLKTNVTVKRSASTD